MGAPIRSSASGESLRPIRNKHWRPAKGGATELRSSGPMGVVESSSSARDECWLSRPLPPSRDGGGRRRVLPGLSSPVDVDGGGDFVSVVVMLEAQTAPRSSYVVSSMLARLPCGGMGSLCVVPVLPDL